MKKSAIILLHIGFWVCYFILIMVMLGVMFGRDEATADEKISKAFETIIFFALIPSAISFYGFYYVLFPRFFQQKKYILSALYGILISLCGGLIGYMFLYMMYKDVPCGEEASSAFVGMVLFMSFIALICGIIALVIQGFITWFEETQQKEALMEKNHEMEMALVKSQLDPHFLFNTINNIDVLILRNANKASDYLNNLSDIMRFMLFETKTDEILLSKELEYIKKYIELQKIRTSNSNYVHLTVTGDAGNKTIAPMVFIPFIENAFKHTNNKKIEDAINITINITEYETVLICENKFEIHREPNQESHGLGNVLIQKRLQLIYPNTHILKLTNENGLYTVHLIIDNE